MSEKKFDDEKQRNALAWLDQKWPQAKRKCEICGSEKWSISSDFTTPLVFDGGIQIGGNAYPTVDVVCQHCGNTKYFNAVKMGLIEAKKDESK